jgi:hypothetical protein
MPSPLDLKANAAFTFLALLDRTTPKLLNFGSRTSKSGHHALSDHRTLELREDTEHLEHGTAGRGGRVESLLVQEQIDQLSSTGP